MKQPHWSVQKVIGKTSSLPLRLSILTLAFSLILGIVISFHYEIEQTVTAEGEISDFNEVRLNVNTRQIASIEKERSIRLTVESFPIEQFGQFSGKVLDIDRTRVIQESGQRYFKVKASISGNEPNMIAGLKVTAFIQTRKIPASQIILERLSYEF
jgi:hypothetical protein